MEPNTVLLPGNELEPVDEAEPPPAPPVEDVDRTGTGVLLLKMNRAMARLLDSAAHRLPFASIHRPRGPPTTTEPACVIC